MTDYIDQELSNELTIEQIENALAYANQGFPKNAVLAAITQKTSITPLLITWLDDTIENVEDIEDTYVGHIFALFLLSTFQEESAFQLIIKLARLPQDDIEFLISDCITEDLHRFIASTYNGDLSAIKTLIEDESVNEWSRQAGLNALVMLANKGRIDVDEIVQYFSSLFTHPSFNNEDMLITYLVSVCSDFLPHRFYEHIKDAFNNDRVDTFYISLEDVENSLSMPNNEYLNTYYSLITDPITELKDWDCFKKPKNLPKNEYSDPFYNSSRFEDSLPFMVSTQVVRDTPKIGRNEPCPCNSGKKYKKCCL